MPWGPLSIRFVASFVVLSALAAPAIAASLATRTFERWTASCNNLGTCTLIGAGPDGGDLVYVRMVRDGGATAAPSVKLVIAVPDGAKGRFDQFRLTAVTGAAKTVLPPVPAKPAPDDPTYVSGTIEAGAASLGLIDAIRNATTLEIAIGGEAAAIELKGFSASLRFIDDRQGRVGGPTALVAKGMTPIGTIPPAGMPPIVTPAPAGSAKEVAKPVASPALRALPAASCDADVLKAQEGLQAWQLGPDRLLFVLSCESGAYNFIGALYLTDAKGKAPRAVTLPRPPGPSDDTAPNLITNGSFDPNTMELSEFAKGRGLGDCGSLTTWVWTGQAFALLTASALDSCPGAFSDDWPNIYTAVKR